MAIRDLDAIHGEINAIGGHASNDYERGINYAVIQALAIIERFGGRDPLRSFVRENHEYEPRWEIGKNGWDASDETTREDI